MRTPTCFDNLKSTPRGGWRALLAGLLLLTGLTNTARGQSFLQANGPKIVNASGQEVILNGMNLGGWALQEGYIVKPGWQGLDGKQTQGTVKRVLYNAGMSDPDVEAFYQSYRDNFITKPDIDYLAGQGFNCVRLPLHYDLFLTPAQRAVRNGVLRGTVSYEAYVTSLTNAYNNNQLFQDPANLEAVRMIDRVLTWCAANNMYVILDLHAAPGAQGTDANIADQLQPLDFWNRTIYQDITNRLWATIAQRYKNDARVAMYDLINEPNNVPSNPQMHDVFQRLINTVRATGDQHLLLLEGNGYGNDYNYLEPYTFTNAANLVYNSHRYSGTGYLMDNGVSSTGGGPNDLRFIGNLTRFRTTHNVPIWVGETGENTATWMNEAAKSLNSVGIGYCHWTYKRFENIPNAALMHINPPYIVDGPGGLPQVLENIKFANCVPNPNTVAAVSPALNGLVNYPGGGNYNGTSSTAAPIGATIWLQSNTNNKYVSSEGGTQPMTCTHDAYAAAEQFVVESAGGSKIALRSLGKYVSLTGNGATLTCNQTAVASTEKFEWMVITSGLIGLRGPNDRYVSSENGTQAMSCNRTILGATEVFRFGILAQPGTGLATTAAQKTSAGAYPNPVLDRLTYSLPAGLKSHRLTLSDATGRTVLTRRVEASGATHTLDVSGLRNGLYLVQLSGTGFSQQFKIIKQ